MPSWDVLRPCFLALLVISLEKKIRKGMHLFYIGYLYNLNSISSAVRMNYLKNFVCIMLRSWFDMSWDCNTSLWCHHWTLSILNVSFSYLQHRYLTVTQLFSEVGSYMMPVLWWWFLQPFTTGAGEKALWGGRSNGKDSITASSKQETAFREK